MSGASAGVVVASVSAADSTLIVTPTTGKITAKMNLAKDNIWTAALTTFDGVIRTTGIPELAGTNATGAGEALLGANSPAVTLSAPYTWIRIVTADGSTAYIPVWK